MFPVLDFDPFLCRAHEEIELWKEKQIQVAKEEMRLKESLVKFQQEQQINKKISRQATRASIKEVQHNSGVHSSECIFTFYIL